MKMDSRWWKPGFPWFVWDVTDKQEEKTRNDLCGNGLQRHRSWFLIPLSNKRSLESWTKSYPELGQEVGQDEPAASSRA